MRLMMRWSPTSKVFCMDSEGITRAWPTAPLMSRNTKPTQNHATTSRQTFCSIVSSGCFLLSGGFLLCSFLYFTFHHHGHISPLRGTFHHYRSAVGQLAEIRSFAHFQLH